MLSPHVRLRLRESAEADACGGPAEAVVAVARHGQRYPTKSKLSEHSWLFFYPGGEGDQKSLSYEKCDIFTLMILPRFTVRPSSGWGLTSTLHYFAKLRKEGREVAAQKDNTPRQVVRVPIQLPNKLRRQVHPAVCGTGEGPCGTWALGRRSGS